MLLVILLHGKGSSPCSDQRRLHMEMEQSPTRPYTAKFTCAAFAVASLSPPGWEKIDRWTFLKPLLEGKHLSCTCNESRTKQEWHLLFWTLCNFKVSPDKWLLASHLWGAVFSTAVPSLYYLFSSAFPSSYSDHPYPFISKYYTIIYNYRTRLWSLSEFPTAISCLCVLQIPDLRFTWWQDNLPFTLKLPLHHSANLSKIWLGYCKARLGHDF